MTVIYFDFERPIYVKIFFGAEKVTASVDIGQKIERQ